MQDGCIVVLREGHVMHLATDGGVPVSRGTEEELGEIEIAVVDEEAGQRGPEGIQQAESVDEGVPGLAGAASCREAVRRKAVEDGDE
jgi:hypothetical protein